MAGRRILLAGLGLLATGLAVLGVWVPGLPVTPFVLVALWAFSLSSARLSAWLRRIPVLRAALGAADRYLAERTLPIFVRVIAPVAAWTAVPLVWLLTGSVWVALVVAVVAAICTVFMVLTPSDRTRPA